MTSDRLRVAPRRLTCLGLALALWAGGGCGDGRPSAGPDLPEQVAQAMRLSAPDMRAKRLVQVAKLQHEARDLSGAQDTLVNALQAARSAEDPALRASALNAVGFAFAQMDEKSKALQTWLLAKQAADQIEEPLLERVAALCSLSIAYGQYLDRPQTSRERLDEARELIPSLADQTTIAEARLRVAYTAARIQAAERTAWWDEALDAARSQPDARRQADALANAAEHLHRLNDSDGAWRLFQEAQRIAESVESPLSRGYALLHLADRLLAANRRQAAQQQFEAAIAAARQVADAGLQQGLLDDIRRHAH